ncbi:hypothetical protein D3C72_1946490 [compost metagenome]
MRGLLALRRRCKLLVSIGGSLVLPGLAQRIGAHRLDLRAGAEALHVDLDMRQRGEVKAILLHLADQAQVDRLLAVFGARGLVAQLGQFHLRLGLVMHGRGPVLIGGAARQRRQQQARRRFRDPAQRRTD